MSEHPHASEATPGGAPVISVLLTSYNNADTILRAMYSVMLQQCGVPFELVVLDDGSTDLTRRLLYVEQRKVRIGLSASFRGLTVRYFQHRGLPDSITDGIWCAYGKYLCFIGADDVWTDVNKLQLQYDYMEAHPERGMTFTNAIAQTGDHKKAVFDSEPLLTYDQILYSSSFVCITTMIRKDLLLEFMNPLDFRRFFSYDFVLALLYARVSKIGYLPQVTGKYYLTLTESTTRTHKRGRRLRHTLGKFKIRLYFIRRFGCNPVTAVKLAYRLARDLYSIVFLRWYK